MAYPEQFNADQAWLWNELGLGGHAWARQGTPTSTLAPVSEALLALTAPRIGERVLTVGCGLRCVQAVACACRRPHWAAWRRWIFPVPMLS
jgi:hypothetical protein